MELISRCTTETQRIHSFTTKICSCTTWFLKKVQPQEKHELRLAVLDSRSLNTITELSGTISRCTRSLLIEIVAETLVNR